MKNGPYGLLRSMTNSDIQVMEKKTITLEVTLNEAKKIFEALGKQPFEEVYELIGKLNDQINTGYGKEGEDKEI